MQRDSQFLLDILQSAQLIVRYIDLCSKDDFICNMQLQDSVVRRLLIIAEAARRVSDTTKLKFPAIAWHEINGMRNRLVHEYDDVDLDILWNTLQSEIPALIDELKSQLPSNEDANRMLNPND